MGREVQVAEVVAEARVAGRVADAALGLAQGRVGAGEVPDVEADVEPVLLERLLDHEADLVEQELVAEAVLPGLDGEQAGAGRRAGVAALDPAECPDARCRRTGSSGPELSIRNLTSETGVGPEPGSRPGPGRYPPRVRPAATPPPGPSRPSSAGGRERRWEAARSPGRGRQSPPSAKSPGPLRSARFPFMTAAPRILRPYRHSMSYVLSVGTGKSLAPDASRSCL